MVGRERKHVPTRRKSIRDVAVHGLTLRIEGDLPLDLPPAAKSAIDLEVLVQRRPVWADASADSGQRLYGAEPDDDGPGLIEAAWVANGAGVRMRYAEGVSFWIDASLRTIWVEFSGPGGGADAAYFLLEPVLAFLLRLRGTLALHASAVVIGGRGVAFCALTGGGKSTAAAACLLRGAAMLADDLVAVEESGAEWLAHSGTRSIRLWAQESGGLVQNLRDAPAVSATWDKRNVAPAFLGARPWNGSVPLAMVCALTDDESDSAPTQRLIGAQAVRALLPNTSASYLHTADRRARELMQLGRFVERVPIMRVQVRRDAGDPHDVAAFAFEHLGA
jgi:hypothetical protein